MYTIRSAMILPDLNMLASTVTTPGRDRRLSHLSPILEEAGRDSFSLLHSPLPPISPRMPPTSSASPLPPPPPPPWDRTCDVSFGPASLGVPLHAPSPAQWNQTLAMMYSIFKRPLADAHAHTDAHALARFPPLLQLPDSVRIQIYAHLLPHSDQPIRLNPLVFTRPVWPATAFATLSSVLAEPSLKGLLSASFRLRAEVLATVFCTRRFHAVFSPYVRPAVCPLATEYLAKYGSLMQHLTLELDCTRLGYGMHPAAAGLSPGILSMDSLVADVATSMSDRRLYQKQHNTLPCLNLVVLCRRYHGIRPVSSSTSSSSGEPYVGPELERVVGLQLGQLAGLVSSARLVGFTDNFSLELLATLNPPPSSASPPSASTITRHWPSDLYPLLPGHRAYVDGGPGLGICLSTQSALTPVVYGGHEQSASQNPRSAPAPPSSLPLAPSRSWMLGRRPKSSACTRTCPKSSSFIAARLAAAGLRLGLGASPSASALSLPPCSNLALSLFKSSTSSASASSASSASSTSSTSSTVSTSTSTSTSSASSTSSAADTEAPLGIHSPGEKDTGKAWTVGFVNVHAAAAGSRPRKPHKLQKKQRVSQVSQVAQVR